MLWNPAGQFSIHNDLLQQSVIFDKGSLSKMIKILFFMNNLKTRYQLHIRDTSLKKTFKQTVHLKLN